MEPTIYDITLELQRACAPWALTVKKGDTGRRLRLRLLSGGKAYPITDDCYAVFTAQKPDGTVIYNSCSREGDRFVYDLTPQTTAAAGVLPCELRLYGKDDALLTSAAFTVTVEDTVYTEGDEAVTSAGEATALTRLITQARDTIGEMEKEMEKLLANEVNHAVIDDATVGADAWSAKNIADKLCPPFTQSGSVVTCEPVEGYPLDVASAMDNSDGITTINLYHGGKNLIPKKDPSVYTKNGATVTLNDNGSVRVIGTPTAATSCDIWSKFPATHLAGKQVAIANTVGSPIYVYVHLHLADGTDTWTWLIGTNANRLTGVVPTDIKAMTVGVAVLTSFDGNPVTIYPQLEFGSVSTDYEQSKDSKTLTADLSDASILAGRYNWRTGILIDETDTDVGTPWYQHDPETGTFTAIADPDAYSPRAVRSIPAYSGTNILISDCGDTTVSGKADPIAIIQKQEQRLAALEAAIISNT